MSSLEGQRILFIAPRFFGYEREIVAALRERGAVVDWLADRPYDSPLMAAATRFAPRTILPLADRLYYRQIEELAPAGYNQILVVNGQTVSLGFLTSLRRWFPTALFTLYMWDSLENRGRTVDSFRFFDRVLSFDPETVKTFGIQLRPLFFTRTGDPILPGEAAYEAIFIGTAHSDRYAVITGLRARLDPAIRTFWFLYLQSAWLFYAYKTIKPDMRSAKRSDFSFAPMDKHHLHETVARSIAIVDIEHPRQRGLTMRTFETMGLNRKLITTNRHVAEYEFFDRNNILVIDRQEPVVPVEFFTDPYRPLAPQMAYRYSLEGWIDEVLVCNT